MIILSLITLIAIIQAYRSYPATINLKADAWNNMKGLLDRGEIYFPTDNSLAEAFARFPTIPAKRA